MIIVSKGEIHFSRIVKKETCVIRISSLHAVIGVEKLSLERIKNIHTTGYGIVYILLLYLKREVKSSDIAVSLGRARDIVEEPLLLTHFYKER